MQRASKAECVRRKQDSITLSRTRSKRSLPLPCQDNGRCLRIVRPMPRCTMETKRERPRVGAVVLGFGGGGENRTRSILRATCEVEPFDYALTTILTTTSGRLGFASERRRRPTARARRCRRGVRVEREVRRRRPPERFDHHSTFLLEPTSTRSSRSRISQ